MVMHVELQATCSALGYQEGDSYVKEPDCLETVKDLIRFLKREDDTLDIRRQLGHAQILQNDLIPIVKQYHDDENLFETVLRLMVNLTQPTILCFGNKLPNDKTMRNYALEIDSHLQSYKEVFLDEELFAVLSEKIGSILKLDWEHRQEEDKLLLERLLILIRNILHIPPNPDLEQRTDDDASIHDQILWVMHVSGLEDMLLYIASSDEERQLCMHLLEIISLMFREQTPEILASAGMQRSRNEKEKDEKELELVRTKEQREKKMNMLKNSTRHSRFGGTYVVLNMKSISDKDLIYHKSQADVQNLSLDLNKKYKKKSKNLAPIKDTEVHRRSTLSIRLCLKEFIIQFLENCYNPLMLAVKDNLLRAKTQDHDETYYLWAMRFFMEFCRLHSKRVELVSETLSVPTFHYIYNNLLTYYEMIMTEKKEAITWSKRVHLALKAYQELLLTLDMMDRSRNPQLIESSKVIKSNIFYMMEFRDIFGTLLKRFNQSKQSRAYLKDLVESTHLFLKMLDHHSRQTHLVVQKKKKTNHKKKQTKANKNQSNEPSEQELEDSWDEISDELSALFQGRSEIPTDITPFDAASEVDVDQQRAEAMINIQDALRGHRAGEGVALLRAAREVWPERNDFGTPDISPEDEFMALREIFMTSLPRLNTDSSVPAEMEAEHSENEADEEEEMESVSMSEQSFDFKTFLHTFAKGDILKGYGLLLADFEKNSTYTNHCVLKMLHRIAVELGYPAMIFQASIFRVFQKVLLGPYAKLSRYQELARFAMFIVRKFTEIAEGNKKIFMEMLFWKGNRESMEITDGYGSFSTKVKNSWTEDQQEELLRLYEMFRENEDPEKDTVDLIMERFTDPTKRRGQIINEMKKLNIITSAKDLKRKKTSSKAWTAEDEFELADLHATHKNSDDPVGNIMSEMSNKRSRNKIIEKLVSCGLVQDRKELYKKRRSKKKTGSDDDDDVDDDGDGYDEGDGFIVREDGGDRSDLDDKHSSSDDDSDVDSKSDSEADNLLETPAAPSSVADSLRNLVTKGYKEQIGWIQTKLRRVADDREEDDDLVPIPLVPLTEENETAMEDAVFTDFLQLIGLSPPANEQEAFWRIPVDLLTPDLRSMADGLELDESGEPVAADKIKPRAKKPTKSKKEKKRKKDLKKVKRNDKRSKTDESKNRESKKKAAADRMKALQDMMKKRKEGKRKRRNSDSEKIEKRRRLEESDKEVSQSDHDDENMEEDSSNQSQATKQSAMGSDSKSQPRRQKIKLLMDSDSESDRLEESDKEVSQNDHDDENMEEKSSNQSQATKQRLMGSGSKSQPRRQKIKRMMDSDSESDRLEESDKEVSQSDHDDENMEEESSNQSQATKQSAMGSGSKSQPRRQKIKRMMDSDSESDSDEDRLVVNEDESSSQPISKRPKLFNSDDSSSDDELLTNRTGQSQNSTAPSQNGTALSQNGAQSSKGLSQNSTAQSQNGTALSQNGSQTNKGPSQNGTENDENSTSEDELLIKKTSTKIFDNSSDGETSVRKFATKSCVKRKTNAARITSDDESESNKITQENNVPSRVQETSPPASDSESSDDEPLLNKLKTLAGKKPSVFKDKTNMASSSEDEPLLNKLKTLAGKKTSVFKDKTNMASSSEDESLVLKLDATQSLQSCEPDNDDDSHVERSEKSKTESFPATMLSQLHDDSDSDVDDHVPLRRALHRKIIESDDDD